MPELCLRCMTVAELIGKTSAGDWICEKCCQYLQNFFARPMLYRAKLVRWCADHFAQLKILNQNMHWRISKCGYRGANWYPTTAKLFFDQGQTIVCPNIPALLREIERIWFEEEVPA